METDKPRVSREEWRKRVERWQDSGLTADEFAAELGINAATLKYWKYQLGKGEKSASDAKRGQDVPPLVEVRAAITPARDCDFSLELRGERRLRIPAQFDAEALKRILSVLEPQR